MDKKNIHPGGPAHQPPLDPNRLRIYARMESCRFDRGSAFVNVFIANNRGEPDSVMYHVPIETAAELVNRNNSFEMEEERPEVDLPSECNRCHAAIAQESVFALCDSCWKDRVREMEAAPAVELELTYGGD